MAINLGDIEKQNYSKYYTNVGGLNLSKNKVPSSISKTKKEEEKRTWFDKGAFDDGYQVGDILKTIGGTVGNVGVNLAKGVVRAGESLGDLGAYGGAQLLDWVGADNYANQVRQTASESLTDKIFAPVDKVLDKNSLLGEKSQDVISSIGNMYAQGITSAKLLGTKSNVPLKIGSKTFNLPVTSLIQGASGGISEAYQKGAEDWQAWLNGVGSGLAEGVSESLFGTFGLGGSDLDDALVKSVTSKMKSSLAKNLAKWGIKATGEGVEEVASYLMNYASGQALDFVKNKAGLKGVDIANEFNKEELWDNFIGGALAAGIGGLPSTIQSIRGQTPKFDTTEGVNQFNLPTVQEITETTTKPSEITIQEAVEQDKAFNTQLRQENLPSQTAENTQIIENKENTTQDKTNLSKQEIEELENLKVLEETFGLEQSEQERLTYLTNKQNNLIKYPELKTNTKYEDIKNVYNTYKNLEDFDYSLLNQAKDIVQGYKNTEKRTKQQWLDIARYIGTNFKDNNSKNLEKYAIQSWFATQPNQKQNLNRQNSKYVKFTIEDWINEVYKGAGVGETIKTNAINSINTPNFNENVVNDTNIIEQPNLPVQLNKEPNINSTEIGVNLPIQQEVTPQTNKKTLNPIEIAQLTKEDASTTPNLPTKRVEKGDKVSRFTKNIKKSNILSEQTKQTLLSDEDITYYKSVTNQESLEKAFERLNKGGKSETLNWFSKQDTNADSTDIAEGFILLNQYQKEIEKTTDLAKKDELNKAMVEVTRKIRNMGTQSAQVVQAMSILSRLTPEGMVYYAQAELDEAYNQMVKNKTKEWIDKYKEDFVLTPEETQFIMDTMKEVSTMQDGYDKRVKLAEIQKVMTDKLPPERGAGMKAWMRISMLFNPKTQIRNVAGNAIIAPINWFGDIVGSAVDAQIAKTTGVRTKGASLKGYGKGVKEGLFQSYNDFKKGINTRNIQGNRFEIGQGKSFNDKTKVGKALNRVDNLLSFMLDAGDRAFYEGEFTRSINNQLVLNNTTEVTQDMIDIATNEALQRTWQDNNDYTKFVLNVRNNLNKINFKGYGLGDVLIPFAKTPANLTKALIDYSPAGMISAINKGVKLKRSLTNGQYTPQLQNDFVNQLGKATAGTMLYILGTALAKAGVTSGESDEDKDVANFLKNTLGINSYSIKLGDISFTYDWAQPIAGALAITANVEQKSKDGADLYENILSSLDTAGSILLEQSFLESINTALNNNDGFVSGLQEAILDLPSRAIPTLSSQIANMVDSTTRTSFEYDKPLESMINSIKYKIPFLTKDLAPSVNTLGEDIQRYGGANNIFNVFLNPANVNVENINDSASEIYRLYQATGDKTIMPRVAPYYINQDGEKITLSSKQKAEYQTISGNIITENVENLLDNQVYNSMSDADKATIINKIVNYAYNKAREEVLDIPMASEYNKINMYVADGGNASEYYTNKEEIDYSYENPIKYSTIRQITTYSKYQTYKDGIKQVKENYNDTQQRKYAVINYVNNLNLSIPQKAMLIKMNYSSFRDYDNQIIEYINSQDLTIQEKTDILKEIGFTVENGRVY